MYKNPFWCKNALFTSKSMDENIWNTHFSLTSNVFRSLLKDSWFYRLMMIYLFAYQIVKGFEKYFGSHWKMSRCNRWNRKLWIRNNKCTYASLTPWKIVFSIWNSFRVWERKYLYLALFLISSLKLLILFYYVSLVSQDNSQMTQITIAFQYIIAARQYDICSMWNMRWHSTAYSQLVRVIAM